MQLGINVKDLKGHVDFCGVESTFMNGDLYEYYFEHRADVYFSNGKMVASDCVESLAEVIANDIAMEYKGDDVIDFANGLAWSIVNRLNRQLEDYTLLNIIQNSDISNFNCQIFSENMGFVYALDYAHQDQNISGSYSAFAKPEELINLFKEKPEIIQQVIIASEDLTLLEKLNPSQIEALKSIESVNNAMFVAFTLEKGIELPGTIQHQPTMVEEATLHL